MAVLPLLMSIWVCLLAKASFSNTCSISVRLWAHYVWLTRVIISGSISTPLKILATVVICEPALACCISSWNTGWNDWETRRPDQKEILCNSDLKTAKRRLRSTETTGIGGAVERRDDAIRTLRGVSSPVFPFLRLRLVCRKIVDGL